MAIACFVLGILSLGLAVLGGIKPHLVLRWGKSRTRERAVITYGAAAVVLLVVGTDVWKPSGGVSAVPEDSDQPSADSPATAGQTSNGDPDDDVDEAEDAQDAQDGVDPARSAELRAFAQSALGEKADRPGLPDKVTRAKVFPESAYATVHFRADDAPKDEQVVADLFFDKQVLYEAFFDTPSFQDLDQLEVSASLEIPGKRGRLVETQIARSVLHRGDADKIPWVAVSGRQFEAILQRDANLVLRPRPYR